MSGKTIPTDTPLGKDITSTNCPPALPLVTYPLSLATVRLSRLPDHLSRYCLLYQLYRDDSQGTTALHHYTSIGAEAVLSCTEVNSGLYLLSLKVDTKAFKNRCKLLKKSSHSLPLFPDDVLSLRLATQGFNKNNLTIRIFLTKPLGNIVHWRLRV